MRRVGLALAAALLFPASAAAQTPPPAPTPTGRRPTLKMTAEDAFGGSRPVALTGRSFTARVVLRPYVAGETVTLRVYRGGKKIRVKALTPQPVNGGTAGVAKLKVKSAKPGRLLLRASHAATPALPTLRAKTVGVTAVRPERRPRGDGPGRAAAAGAAGGDEVRRPAHGRLRRSAPANAVMAWRKVAGLSRTTLATSEVFSGVLAGRGKFKVRHPGDGRHVEARLNSQVMALIDKGKVQRIYHISSGAPATPTVRGKFRVYLKTPGTNAKGMVHSSYFIRGYAIHGYASVPPYNASHGCLRVPVPNARSIYDWLRIGDVVWVEP